MSVNCLLHYGANKVSYEQNRRVETLEEIHLGRRNLERIVAVYTSRLSNGADARSPTSDNTSPIIDSGMCSMSSPLAESVMTAALGSRLQPQLDADDRPAGARRSFGNHRSERLDAVVDRQHTAAPW